MRPVSPLLALLLAAGSSLHAEPTSVAIDLASPGPIFTNVPVTLELVARNESGSVDDSYDGFVLLDGAWRRSSDGDLAPLTTAGPLVNGRLTLPNVLVLDDNGSPSGTITARIQGVELEGNITRTVFPGFLTLLPALVAISLALLSRQVILSLFCGIWVGAILLHDLDPLRAFLRTTDTYLVGSLADDDHAHIVLFSLSLAGMIGVVMATGGMRGVVELVSRYARTRRSGQLSTWLLGCLIFFDDYTNSLLDGNTMRPFTDRLRISREKLSFVVDATAAPVATIGVISTWTAYQVGVIDDVLEKVPGDHDPAYVFFLRSIPFAVYSFLMLLLVLLVGWPLRDIGPMRAAERRCRDTGAVLREGARPLAEPDAERSNPSESPPPPRWINAALPIACLVFFTVLGLWSTGVEALDDTRAPKLRDIIGNADSYRALLWSSLGASVVAILLGLVQRQRLSTLLDSWVGGARSLVFALMVLVLAWAISRMSRDVGAGHYVASLARDVLSGELVPVIAFVTAGVIAFATGTSYGTMAILVPILLPLAFSLSDGDEAVALATAAAVLGGSVFGDHCSPISDTTVLSSMACGADHIDHVRTQLPYALLVAAVSVPCYVLLGFGRPWWLVLPVGAGALVALFLLLSRRPQETPNGER